MANDHTASIITLHQPVPAPLPTAPKTAAERAKAYRERKRQNAEPAPASRPAPVTNPIGVTKLIDVTKDAATPTVTNTVTASRWSFARVTLNVAACGLAMVGVTMNGWFARSLGSSEIAGWLFLAIGVAADLVALAVPACAAGLWHTRQRGAAMAGWVVWLMVFAFAVTAGIGFASVNITDVTTARAGRVTPAITAAQAALTDAMASRDRECVGGVGKNCRAREDAVVERRRTLDHAMRSVEQTADPQVEAASRIVAWVSGGLAKPSGDDFAMLRLILLALLPQVGGILLMVGRR